jgi:hypothetical protein
MEYGFLGLKDPAKKSRTYMLHPEIEKKLFG